MTRTMRAAVLDRPGPATNLRVRDVPVPTPRPGWVLIESGEARGKLVVLP
jgi:NADPH:quinone reductase